MRIAMTVAVLLFAVMAAANPIAIELFVDFAPISYTHSTYPPPYTTVEAYVVAELYAGDPVYSVSFDLEVWPGTATVVGSFVPLDAELIVQIVDNGIVVIAPDCIDAFPATLGYLPLLYLGSPGLVEIRPHIDNGHTFITCGDPGTQYDYCYVMPGGIGMEPAGPDELCGNPVQNVAWGAIKALYR